MQLCICVVFPSKTFSRIWLRGENKHMLYSIFVECVYATSSFDLWMSKEAHMWCFCIGFEFLEKRLYV